MANPDLRHLLSNVEAVLPQLEVAPFGLENIRNAVSRGLWVFIPQENLQVLNWTGIGYIVLDPTTGAAGYLLRGRLAGGETAEQGALTQDFVDAANDLAATGLEWVLENEDVVRWGARITGPFNLASNIVDSASTAVEVYEETNNFWKALGAGAATAAHYCLALDQAAIRLRRCGPAYGLAEAGAGGQDS